VSDNQHPDFLYSLDDRLPLWRGLLYGLQWAAIVFPSLIIACALAGHALGLQDEAQVRFLQLTLLLSGAFSVIQSLWGHRYPLLEGPATALLLTFMALAENGIQVIQGGLMLGGLMLTIIGAFRALRRLTHFFTPNVVGVILLLIAFTLLPHLLPPITGVNLQHPAGQYVVFSLSLTLTLVIALLSRWLKGFWQTIAMFLGVVLGTAVFGFLGLVDWRPMAAASWVAGPNLRPLTFPSFHWPSMMAFALAYVAVLVNSVGSIQGIANVTDANRLPTALHRGIIINGLAGIACGLAGIVGTVSYSMSPGVVLVTRVASRYAIAFCGVIVAGAAFVPKLAALFAAVPAPVVGAALCVGLGGQIGAGLAIINSQQHRLSGRDYLVVGLPIIIGTLVSLLPPAFFTGMPAALQAFLGNGLIMGILLVLLLEHLLLREAQTG
jgi:xanthine/uracil permease